MANLLFWFVGTDPNDFQMDYSQLVSAPSVERAVELWAEYWWSDEQTPEEDCCFELTISTTEPLGYERMAIYLVEHDPRVEGVLGDAACQAFGWLKERAE